MIEIQGARNRHSVLRCQDYFGGQSAYCSCSRHDDDFVQLVNNIVSSENENGAALVGEAKRIPADLSSLQTTFSQSSPSQANASSSAENSSLVGGIAR